MSKCVANSDKVRTNTSFRFYSLAGKKGKKTKGKTLNLQEFLGENGGGAAGNSIVTKSWANECEDDDYAPPKIITYAIPTAPRSQRVLDDSTIPTHPPFLAYMSNLPYDLNEQDIQEYFEDATNHQVVSVRLPREDGETGRMRGFGYIEFAEREGLIAAVSLPDPQLRNRNIRIDVSTEQDQKRAGGNRGRYDNLGSSEHRDTNWRRGDGNRYQDNGESNRRSGFAYNRERQGDSAENGGNWRSGERKLDSSPPRRSGGSGSGSGSGSGGGGERYGRRNDYEDRPKREEPVPEERPRLKLNPRTLPLPEFKPQIEEREEEVEKVAPPPRPKPTPVPAAAIFGAAKPVDTAAKDREIEERLERERLQREQAEKERAEQERLQKQIELEEKEKGEEHERKDGMEREVESLRQTVRDFRADEHEQQSLDDGDAEKSNDEAADNAAPAEKEIISWRRKPDEEDTSRTQSPPRRSGRYSPDRRQQRRHNGLFD